MTNAENFPPTPPQAAELQPAATEITLPVGEVIPASVEHALGEIALGESLDDGFAAEFDIDDDMFDDEPDRTPEEVEADIKADKCAMAYTDGIHLGDGEELDGISQTDIDNWYAGLEPDLRDEIDIQLMNKEFRDQTNEYLDQIEERLREETPELFEGRLPADLERLIDGRYVLGTHQSGDSTIEEAGDYLLRHGGIDMTSFQGLMKRFDFFNENTPDIAAAQVVGGHYKNPAMGRFITATPFYGEAATIPDEEVISAAPDAADMRGLLPADYRVSFRDQAGTEHSAINSKYIAGFIDETGTFHRNANFMQSDVPELGREIVGADRGGDWL